MKSKSITTAFALMLLVLFVATSSFGAAEGRLMVYRVANFGEGVSLSLSVDGKEVSRLVEGRILKPQGIYVLVGGGGANEQGLIGGLARPLKAMLLSPFVSQKMGMMFAQLNHNDLAFLADLMESGKVKPVIDRTYKLSDLPEAIRYLEQGHARGKVVITID